MNDNVKISVESRKTALFSAYDVKDPGNLKTIDDYFKKLEEFAKNYNDVMEFETAFAGSPLCKEYSDLFVQIMNTEATVDGKLPDVENEDDSLIDDMQEEINGSIRRRVKRDMYYKARDIPVLGDAMLAKQHLDMFSGFGKKDE